MDFIIIFHSAITAGTQCDPWVKHKCFVYSVVSSLLKVIFFILFI